VRRQVAQGGLVLDLVGGVGLIVRRIAHQIGEAEGVHVTDIGLLSLGVSDSSWARSIGSRIALAFSASRLDA
jgi:hypothetical protein